MQALTGVVRNGRLELNEPINWPEGTAVEVTVQARSGNGGTPATEDRTSYRDFILSIAGSFGSEPFERPPQGEFEKREEW